MRSRPQRPHQSLNPNSPGPPMTPTSNTPTPTSFAPAPGLGVQIKSPPAAARSGPGRGRVVSGGSGAATSGSGTRNSFNGGAAKGIIGQSTSHLGYRRRKHNYSIVDHGIEINIFAIQLQTARRDCVGMVSSLDLFFTASCPQIWLKVIGRSRPLIFLLLLDLSQTVLIYG